MASWTIKPLLFGTIEVKKEQLTTGLDMGLPVTVPYLGFYCTDGEHNILVDTGINAKYIVDGKAWAGSPAAGGADWVLNSLQNISIDPKTIDFVIYTHLHNDHAGNCMLFANAVHVFQEAEWKELLDPLPSMRIRGDYDQSLIPELENLQCMKVIGDLEFLPGMKFMLTPGHTAGSQCVLLETREGTFNLAGDTVHVSPIAFPEMTEWRLMDGTIMHIQPAPKHWGPAVPSSLVYDHYSWYKSIYKIKSMLREPRFLIPGHEPGIIGMKFG